MELSAIQSIVNKFLPGETVIRVAPIEDGHIHQTLMVDAGNSYILQQINSHVFTDVISLMDNIAKVTRKLKSCPAYLLQTPEMICTPDGNSFVQDEAGMYWRLFTFLKEGKSYMQPLNESMSEEAGRAFGHFHLALQDLDPSGLHLLLPHFHDMGYRYKQFQESLRRKLPGRFREAGEEIKMAETWAGRMSEYQQGFLQAGLPQRVIHHDPKLNNILFYPDGSACAIIDLDTTMPGLILSDFGDVVRTLSNNSAEDERDTCHVRFQIRHFEHFCKGYLRHTSSFLHPEEIERLAFAPLFITYLQGLRFLTDHLNGDEYYKVDYFGHNLVRASVQFTLLRGMDARLEQMQAIVESLMLEYVK